MDKDKLREVLMKLLVEHGDREFKYRLGDGMWTKLVVMRYIKYDAYTNKDTLTPKALAFLKQTE